MNQASTRKSSPLVNESFHTKSAGVSFVVILAIGMYFFANLVGMDLSGSALPAGFLTLLLTSTILLIVVEAVLQIVLVIGVGEVSPLDESERSGVRKAQRNAYAVLSTGVVITLGSLFFAPTTVVLASLLLGVFILAELVRLVSQIAYR